MKKIMRREFLAMRNAMVPEDRAEKSAVIIEKIIQSQEYKNAGTVFTYVSMGSEAETNALIEKAWSDGKRVAVPVAKKDRLMYFVEINSFDNMKKSALGVTEPDIPIENQVFPDENDLFIVPGSMFDESRNRCGYGGGYYDTYISKNNVKNTVGICFDFQVAASIPVEEFDRKVYKIVTEKREIV